MIAIPMFLLADLALGAGPPIGEARELRTSPVTLRVRGGPGKDSVVLGLIAPNEPFQVLSRVAGTGCGGDGWGMLERGYTCLATTAVVDSGEPSPLPYLVTFDPPSPDEYRAYVRDGTWPRDPTTTEAMLPFVYGKAWRHWRGTNYASLDAWERGDAPVDTLADDRKYHFVRAVEAVRGPVLVRDDGKVVPVADAFIYPVSRFHGVELTGAGALAQGEVQAWVYPYGGANVREAPGGNAAVALVLPEQTPLHVVPTADARWYSVPDALGPGLPGYVAASVIRRVVPAPPPPDLRPDELWIDVDISQQVVMLVQGEVPVFATLTSTGLDTRDTPTGTYRIQDKTIYGDMKSLPDALEQYHVEAVPWVMHFRPRYALHGVFWHWGFGHRASHGCINLAPLDAHRIFDAVSPVLPDGWSSVVATPEEPGTTVRVR